MPEKLTKGWTRVAFGDVVRQVRDRVDPEKTDLERYVAGEHMDTDDLKIRRWGLIGDGYLGPAFNMRFKPGHVLYGSRRTYLRKVSVADFEGITANTTFVLESKDPKVLLPELLPFIMQSESFHEHSIKQSKGSVNPYINFSDLTWYEFALPPLDDQQRIAKALLAGQETRCRLEDALTGLATLYNAAGREQFARSSTSGLVPEDWQVSGWTCRPLDSLVVSGAPICYGIVQVRDHDASGVPTVAIKNLGGDFRSGLHHTRPEIEAQFARSRVEPGDVLLSIKATIGGIAIVPDWFRGNISRDLARLRLNRQLIRPRFFLHLYRSPRFSRYVKTLIVGSTRAELSIAALRGMSIPAPSVDDQDRLTEEMDAILDSKTALSRRLEQVAHLNRQIRDLELGQAEDRR